MSAVERKEVFHGKGGRRCSMAKKKYRRYSPEFKRHALKRASEDGVTDKGVCEDLGISERQLRRWRDQYRLLGDEAFPGQGKSRDEELA
jgi:transposase